MSCYSFFKYFSINANTPVLRANRRPKHSETPCMVVLPNLQQGAVFPHRVTGSCAEQATPVSYFLFNQKSMSLKSIFLFQECRQLINQEFHSNFQSELLKEKKMEQKCLRGNWASLKKKKTTRWIMTQDANFVLYSKKIHKCATYRKKKYVQNLADCWQTCNNA